jgi:hypothetical protein
VIFEQRDGGVRVHRGYVTVHIDPDRRVFLVKNRAAPTELLGGSTRATWSRDKAVRSARRAIHSRDRAWSMRSPEKVWFPLGAELILAWKVRLQRERPLEEWIVYVSAKDGKLLSRWDNLASARGWGRIFDPNPVVAIGSHRALLSRDGRPRVPPETAYRTVRLEDLDGKGRLDGLRVTTKCTPRRAVRPDLRFEYPARSHAFEETMAYYHVDRSMRHLEQLGYRGDHAIFTEPLEVDAHGSRAWNAWYSPELRRLVFGTESVDSAEDGEVILHELGHAIQDAIVPDFGQSAQAAAMGEGFGDYWAASAFAERKQRPAQRRYLPCVMSWWGVEEEGDPPCVRRVDALDTFESFDPAAGEHDNGPIWSAPLWEIRAAFGRTRADRLIVESHFQLDGFTTFARGARAILDSNRSLYDGRGERTLVRIFTRRGIGPLE